MKKLFSFIISFCLGALLFWASLKYFISWQETTLAFHGFSFVKGAVIFLIAFGIILTEVWRWKIILANRGFKVGFKKLLPVYLAHFSIVYLVPVGLFWADFFRARAVMRREKIPEAKSVAVVFIDRILSSFVNLLIIFFGLLFFLTTTNAKLKLAGGLYLGVLAFFVFIFVFFFIFLFYAKAFKASGLLKFFLNGRIEELGPGIKAEIFSFFSFSNFPFFKKAALLSLLRVMLLALQYWLVVFFLGYSLSLPSLIAVFGVSFAATETPISADLGSHDLTNAFIFSKLGLTRGLGLALALVLRGVSLTLAAIGLVLFLKYRLKSLEENLIDKIAGFFKANDL